MNKPSCPTVVTMQTAEAGANYVLLLGVPTSHYLVWWVRVKS